LEFSKLVALRPVTNDQEAKFIRAPSVQKLKAPKQCARVLFRGQAADVEKQLPLGSDA
jgi:hypothetical protein